MRKESVTIAIVYYDNIRLDFFYKSVYSALSQLYDNYKIEIYYDSDRDFFKFNNLVNHNKIPIKYRNNTAQVRQYIVEECKTDYLAFWDSDDIYMIDRISKQINKIEAENGDLIYSNFGFINKLNVILDGDFFKKISFFDRNINLLDENYIGLGSCIFKVESIKAILPFPTLERLDWWIANIFKQTDFKIENTGRKILGYYRVYGESLSSLFNKKSKRDIIKEIKLKLNMYSLLKSNEKIVRRINYYKKVVSNDEYINQMFKKKTKNPWGGLSECKE